MKMIPRHCHSGMEPTEMSCKGSKIPPSGAAWTRWGGRNLNGSMESFRLRVVIVIVELKRVKISISWLAGKRNPIDGGHNMVSELKENF